MKKKVRTGTTRPTASGTCEQVQNTNEYNFVVELKGGAKVRFDILTGKVRPVKP